MARNNYSKEKGNIIPWFWPLDCECICNDEMAISMYIGGLNKVCPSFWKYNINTINGCKRRRKRKGAMNP
jgi:hypothetical protein